MNSRFLTASLAGAAILVATVTLPLAGGHTPVEQREAKMKTLGANAGVIGKMLKGEEAFDAAKANASLVAMKDAFTGLGDLFPEGTEMAGEDKWKASPAIWSDRAGFEAEIAQMTGFLDAAVAAAPQDQAALGAAFGPVGKECGSCHEKFRVTQE